MGRLVAMLRNEGRGKSGEGKINSEPNFDVVKRVRSKSSIIAEHLSERIEKSEMRPGQRLVQEDLAKSYGVSRVAIRDALHKLKQKGLAIDTDTKGLIIRPVSRGVVREIYTIRSILEPFLAQEVCKVIKDSEIQELRRINDEIKSIDIQKDLSVGISKDWQFHHYMYSRKKTTMFLEILELIWARLRQVRSIVNQDEKWLRDWVKRTTKQHNELILLLEGGKPKEVGRRMKEIINEAGERIIMELEALGWAE